MSNLWQLLAFVIPAAIGSAISPTLLASTTGILSQEHRPRAKAVSSLIGAIVALCIWTVIVYSALWALLRRVAADAERYSTVLDFVLGAVLLGVGLVLVILRPPLFKPEAKEKGGADSQPEEHLWRYATLGFVLQGRDVSSIVLFIAALEHIAASPVPIGTKALVLAGLGAITTTPMWVPIVAHITIPGSFKQRAEPFVSWLKQKALIITIAVCVVFGVFLVYRGFTESHR